MPAVLDLRDWDILPHSPLLVDLAISKCRNSSMLPTVSASWSKTGMDDWSSWPLACLAATAGLLGAHRSVSG